MNDSCIIPPIEISVPWQTSEEEKIFISKKSESETEKVFSQQCILASICYDL